MKEMEKSESGKVNYERYIQAQGKGFYPVDNYKSYENMWEYLGAF